MNALEKLNELRQQLVREEQGLALCQNVQAHALMQEAIPGYYKRISELNCEINKIERLLADIKI